MRKGFALVKILPIFLLALILLTVAAVVTQKTTLHNQAQSGPVSKFYDDTSKEFKYQGAWKTAKSALARNGSYRSTTEIGASVSMNVVGINSFNVVVVTDKINGYLDVKIDNSYFYFNKDTYSLKKTYNQKIGPFNLPNTGPHTITLSNSWAKSSSSSGNTLMLEGIETVSLPSYPQTGPNPYTPTPPPTTPIPAPTNSAYDDTNKSLAYTGNWLNARTAAASGGGYKYSATPGNKVSLNISGPGSFTITTIKEKKGGIAKILVNNSQVGTYDTYSLSKTYNAKIGPFDLPGGTNTITMEVLAEKNPLSTNYAVPIDKIDTTLVQTSPILIPSTPVTKKVVLLIYNPILESKGGIRLSELRDYWVDPLVATQGVVKNIKEASNGYLNYDIVDTKVLDEYEEKVDGFMYTDQTYLDVLENRSPIHSPNWVNYNKIISKHNICERVNLGEIDELWLYGGPYSGYWEWTVGGPGSYSHGNDPIENLNCNKLLPVMGFNYETGEDNAFHSFGHRVEGAMIAVYGQWLNNQNTVWNRFTRFELENPGKSTCGNIHHPPNASTGYDYDNKTFVNTSCDDWYLFPYLPQTPVMKTINCDSWECNSYGYYKWWMMHIPHFDGLNSGKEKNWWKYVVDFNNARK